MMKEKKRNNKIKKKMGENPISIYIISFPWQILVKGDFTESYYTKQ